MTIKVCIGSACHIKGSYGIISRLQSLIEQNGLSEQVQIQAVFCLGHCVGAVSVQIDEEEVQTVSLDTVDAFFQENIQERFAKMLYQIMKKAELSPEVTRMDIYAPDIAKKAKPGQFIILRVNAEGERIPLTIADHDEQAGTVTIIFQKVGASTLELGQLKEGEALHDFVGPLGQPTHLDGIRKAAVVGGGLGCAIAYPIAKALHAAGAEGGYDRGLPHQGHHHPGRGDEKRQHASVCVHGRRQLWHQGLCDRPAQGADRAGQHV